MAVLFLVVFIDLVGFGLLIPLLPFYVQHVGAEPQVITAVLGLYSLAQFFSAPLWGRLSDRYGRKPILAVTCAGLALSYLLLAFADSLPLVIASRVFGGLMAGNIAAAQAYIADVTTPATRARGMGILGAAFGLGFIVGPSIGGLLGGATLAEANFTTPALAAMGLSILAAFSVVLFLKESNANGAIDAKTGTGETDAPVFSHAQRFRAVLGRRTLAMLAIAGFLVVTAFAQFETTFALWANAILAYGPRQIGFVLGGIGLVNAAIQGAGMGPLTRRFGEPRLARAAIVLFLCGYGVMAISETPPSMIAACVLLAAAAALFNPTISSLVSQQANDDERGAVLGAYQSAAALGRVAGPAVSGTLFALGSTLPFLAGALLTAPVLFLLARARSTPQQP